MTVTHVAMPTAVEFRAVRFQPVGHTQTFGSELSGRTQVVGLSGMRWRARYELPPMKDANARAWRAFLTSLKGRENLFYGYDPSFRSWSGLSAFTANPSARRFDSGTLTFDNSGVIRFDEWAGGDGDPGSPYVAGGGQTGTSLETAGWLGGLDLKAGEMVAYAYTDGAGNTLRALHMLTADVTTDAAGAATLSVLPPVRIAPADNATVITDKPSCSMRLIDDGGAAWETDAAMFHRISFEAEQVVTAGPAT